MITFVRCLRLLMRVRRLVLLSGLVLFGLALGGCSLWGPGGVPTLAYDPGPGSPYSNPRLRTGNG